MDNNYTQITWPEVRAGDVLLRDNGDRLTVDGRERTMAHEHDYVRATGQLWTTWGLVDAGFAPYRKQPELPTEPGAYADKNGDYWLFDRGGHWYESSSLRLRTVEDAAEYAPFTRLVPMPTEEAVHSAIAPFVGVRDVSVVQAVGRVMSLLEGESDD